jgi:hypothetical protein
MEAKREWRSTAQVLRTTFAWMLCPLALLFLASPIPLAAQQPAAFRPPAVPLVVHDPYFSIWSMADHLYDEPTKHWTGKPHSLTGLIRIDGRTYQVVGRERTTTAVLQQIGLNVLPTRTVYDFTGGGIKLTLTFFTPALPYDLNVLSRPATYIEWSVFAADAQTHEVALYFDASTDLVVNTPDQPVWWGRYVLDGQPVLRAGSREQPILAKRGDDLRIDWGYLYLSTDSPDGVSAVVALHRDGRAAFEKSGDLPSSDDLTDRTPQRRNDGEALAVSFNLGRIGANPVSRYLILAYDDLYSIEYFERRERPWWRRAGAEASDLLRGARKDHDGLLKRSQAFDEELMADMRKIGGEEYARLGALAFRQALAAHKLVADVDGTPMYFPKENFSNGCIGTVDVIYPSSPLSMLFNPQLLEAQLQPVLDYARMRRWPWPFAPHDLGTYPLADGQVYGGGEHTEVNQMPVEESGNMLIMAAALAQVQGSAAFAEKYWPQLTKWAEYLKVKGLDPENQLSTDDFAGHLAHNANLSLKAILALGCYSRLCEATGRKQEAMTYKQLAREFARKWTDLARDGDHYRLAFDNPGTWSQKYNLVWDQILGLHLFPPEVAREELAFYASKQNAYGLPLDNRRTYTKLDWLIWTASLGDHPGEFQKFITPAYRWLNESPSRVPLTDWYDTVSGKQQGFQARSVVGGIFVKMLSDPAIWKKYATRAATHDLSQ